MLRETWLLITAAIIMAGVVAQDAAIVALGALVGIACYAAQVWARLSLRRVTYERVIPEDRAFAGERVGVTLRITNNKPLPLPWIHAGERFPEPMVRDAGGDEFSLAGQVSVAQTDWRTSVGAHQRVSRPYEVACPERGVYEIGPSRLRSGDMFGLFTDERIEERRSRIVVYPRTVEIGDLGLPARRPYGERASGLRIAEDPARVAGVRDYRHGDSLRRIDWNATARRGSLQSRVYDPASSQHLQICLNTQTVIPSWAGTVPELLERSIVVAASLARDAYDRRFSVGLVANASFPEADRSVRIPPGRRPEQFIRILEALAIVTSFVIEPLAAMLDREEHRLGVGTTLAVVTGIMPPELASTLLRLARRGHTVVVLSASGDTWPELLGDALEIRDVSWIERLWEEAPQ